MMATQQPPHLVKPSLHLGATTTPGGGGNKHNQQQHHHQQQQRLSITERLISTLHSSSNNKSNRSTNTANAVRTSVELPKTNGRHIDRVVPSSFSMTFKAYANNYDSAVYDAKTYSSSITTNNRRETAPLRGVARALAAAGAHSPARREAATVASSAPTARRGLLFSPNRAARGASPSPQLFRAHFTRAFRSGTDVGDAAANKQSTLAAAISPRSAESIHRSERHLTALLQLPSIDLSPPADEEEKEIVVPPPSDIRRASSHSSIGSSHSETRHLSVQSSYDDDASQTSSGNEAMSECQQNFCAKSAKSGEKSCKKKNGVLSFASLEAALSSPTKPEKAKKKKSSIRLPFARHSKTAPGDGDRRKQKLSTPSFAVSVSDESGASAAGDGAADAKFVASASVTVRRVASCTFPMDEDDAPSSASAVVFLPAAGGGGGQQQNVAKACAKFALGPIRKSVKKTIMGLRPAKRADSLTSTASPPPTADEAHAWQLSFAALLNHKYGCALFRHFISLEHSEENLEFWERCEQFKKLQHLNSLSKTRTNSVQSNAFERDEDAAIILAETRAIFNTFIANGAEKEVNLDSHTKTATRDALKRFRLLASTDDGDVINSSRSATAATNDEDMSPTFADVLELLEARVFAQAQSKIEQLMEKDSYPRFLKSDNYLSLLNGSVSQKSYASSASLRKHSPPPKQIVEKPMFAAAASALESIKRTTSFRSSIAK